MKTISIDIDGVLNNYPTCWLDYIELQQNEKFTSIEDAKIKLGERVYSDIKEKYRTSGHKGKIPVNPIASEFTKLLKKTGYKIIIATSRPFDLYPGLETLTLNWLKSNNIEFDFLERKKNLLLKNYNLLCHVDDELEHVYPLLKENIGVFIIQRADINYEGYENYPTLQLVNNLSDVLKRLI